MAGFEKAPQKLCHLKFFLRQLFYVVMIQINKCLLIKISNYLHFAYKFHIPLYFAVSLFCEIGVLYV